MLRCRGRAFEHLVPLEEDAGSVVVPPVPKTLIGAALKALSLLWGSDAALNVTGRRFLAVHWDPKLPPEEAAEKAGAPVAWTSIATMPIRPGRS